MKRLFLSAFMIFMLQAASDLYAAVATIERVGTSSTYILRGYDFNNVGGVEIEIQYDSTTLANPRITQGASLAPTMFMPNPKLNASTVKIAAISLSPIKSGDLATITFDLKGASPGYVSVGRQKYANVSGSSVKPTDPPVNRVDTGNKDTGNPPQGQTLNQTASTQTSTQTSPYGSTPSIGSITLPQDLTSSPSGAATDRKPDIQPLVTDLRKDMTLPLGDSAGQQVAAAEQKPEREKAAEKKSVAYKSTLKLFREFTGEKTAKNLIALFAEVSMPGFEQSPTIAIADGETPVMISLMIRQTETESPKFMLNGAKTLGLSGEGEDAVTWTIEALPKKGALEASLTVIDGKVVMEFPLTVVPYANPLLTKGKVLSEADFKAYLAAPGKFDLNKDGKFDAVDDYIYTANYIAAMKIKPQKAAKEEPVKPDAKGDAKPKEKQPVKPDAKGDAKPKETQPVKP